MSSITILDSLLPFQLRYNVRGMAVLANPLCWAARAIGFDAFGWLTTLFERAGVVLVRQFCVALPPSVDILCCLKWSHHKLMDSSDHMGLIQILLGKPLVLY